MTFEEFLEKQDVLDEASQIKVLLSSLKRNLPFVDTFVSDRETDKAIKLAKEQIKTLELLVSALSKDERRNSKP